MHKMCCEQENIKNHAIVKHFGTSACQAGIQAVMSDPTATVGIFCTAP
jgi:hypothetical protein